MPPPLLNSPPAASPSHSAPDGWRGARNSPAESAATAARQSHSPRRHPPGSVHDFVRSATQEFGDIEVLVAGAGDTFFGRLYEIDTDDFEAQVQVHLIGANRLATAVLPGMVKRQRGDVIFIGSDVALRQRPHMGGYGAAKAGLLAMVTNLQMELEGTGVRASIVHPGPTQTEMGWSLPPETIAPHWRTGPSGARHATPISSERPTWHGASHSSPRPRAVASSSRWSCNRRRHCRMRPGNVSN